MKNLFIKYIYTLIYTKSKTNSKIFSLHLKVNINMYKLKLRVAEVYEVLFLNFLQKHILFIT